MDVTVDKILDLIAAKKLWFPSPPAVVVRLSALLSDDNIPLTEVVKLVRTNPILSAKLLQVANSAAWGTGTKLVQVGDAIQRLGSSFVRNLALSLALHEQFHPSDPLLAQVTIDTWTHSVDVGAHSLLLANYLNEEGCRPRMDGSVALLVGVIHSVGELPLMAYATTHGKPASAVIQLPEELKLMVTLAILSKWELPETITDAIAGKGSYGGLFDYAHAYRTEKSPKDATVGGVTVMQEKFTVYVNTHQETLNQFKASFA